ncbi:MAG: (Fe-S)-binding protein [Desulfobacteraceae bacterium]
MGGMKELAERVKELEDQLVTCIRCGTCQAVCPLYGVTRKEADVARGKLALIDGLMRDIFADAQGVEERLNRCLLCGSCAANCPSGVNVVEIFAKARSVLAEYRGLSAAEKFLFRRLLANPLVFDRLFEWIEKFQGILTKSDKNRQNTSCPRLVSSLTWNRHIKPLAPVPFHKRGLSPDPGSRNTGPSVLFFTGCLIDKVYPEIAVDTINALTYHNFNVIVPEGQGCCGIPALAAGDGKTFNRLVEYHLDLFRHWNADFIVTSCATCTSTIKKLWPALYDKPGMSMTTRLLEISEKTMDISQVLDRVVTPRDQGHPGTDRVTYHDPCHLAKSLKVTEEPRNLIRASGKTLAEMEGSDRCCGMGGSFNLKYYDLSTDIGQVKADNILAAGCGTVASSCPACMMQISDMLAKKGKNIYVRHPVQLYAESIKKNI